MWNASQAEWPFSGGAVGPGAVLCGRYVLEERLEHGRLGVVYRAFDRQGQRGRIAVLVLPGEVAGNQRMLAAVREDFERLKTLHHPSIVSVLGLESDGGTVFFTLELVDGESLATILENLRPHALYRRDAVAVIRAVGAALEHAHAHGIAHGDVRPENVIVSVAREVKLLFASTCLLRSPPFSVDARDDVFGLGCLAYELFAGHPPEGGYHQPSTVERLPAPARPKALKGRHWKALRASLAPRDRRTRSVASLLAGLGVARAASRPWREPPRREEARRREPRRSEGRGGSRVAAVVVLLALTAVAVQLNRERVEQWAAAAPTAVDDVLEPVAGLIRRGQTFASASYRAAVERTRLADEAPAAAAEPPAPAQPTSDAPPHADAAPQATQPAEAEDEVAAAAAPKEPAAAAPTGAPALPREVERDEDVPAEPATLPEASPERAPPVEAAPGVAARSAVRLPAAARRAAAPVLHETGTATFRRRDVNVSEGASVVPIEIRRTDPRGPLTVAWWTADGTAIAGEDYANFGALIETFAPGESSRTIHVPITADTLPENLEFFYVSLRAGPETARATGEVTRMTVTIVDDDR